ncbi:hypothetical protein ABPG72_007855 [Tetrahymena utriculariae]
MSQYPSKSPYPKARPINRSQQSNYPNNNNFLVPSDQQLQQSISCTNFTSLQQNFNIKNYYENPFQNLQKQNSLFQQFFDELNIATSPLNEDCQFNFAVSQKNGIINTVAQSFRTFKDKEGEHTITQDIMKIYENNQTIKSISQSKRTLKNKQGTFTKTSYDTFQFEK